MASQPDERSISPAIAGLLSVLVGAYPHPVFRERICHTLGISRETFRQKLKRLQTALGDGAIATPDGAVLLTESAYKKYQSHAVPAADESRKPIVPEQSTVGNQFRDLLLNIAPFAKDEARGMLVGQPWITRAIAVPDLGRLLEATRPANQTSPYAGEWRNLETLVLSLHGAHRDLILGRVEASKKIARRYGQKSIYRRAHLIGIFSRAGETSIPSTELLSRTSLAALPAYDKLAYISRLCLEYRGDDAINATEWAAQSIEQESVVDQAHFWRNATCLSLFAAGRPLAAEARRRTEESKSFALDKDSQRCLLVSRAREYLHSKDPDGAELCARKYRALSQSMGWSDWDALELFAKASILRGDYGDAKRYRDTLLSQLKGAGNDQKRLNRVIISQLDSAMP